MPLTLRVALGSATLRVPRDVGIALHLVAAHRQRGHRRIHGARRRHVQRGLRAGQAPRRDRRQRDAAPTSNDRLDGLSGQLLALPGVPELTRGRQCAGHPETRAPNIEDRRGDSGGGGIRRLHFGIGGTIIVLVLSLLFHRNLFTLLGERRREHHRRAPADTSAPPASETPAEHKEVQFVSFVLDDAQQTWAKILPQEGGTYHDAKLVLFRDGVQSGCGFAETAIGPFYCPLDEKVYIDLGFYDELRDALRRARRVRAGVRARARARAITCSTCSGIDAQGAGGCSSSGPDQANALSVRLELQADCYAGVWGHSTAAAPASSSRATWRRGSHAAAAVGDDRLQRMRTGTRVPRIVHARHVGAARGVVQARLRHRRSEGLRHLLLERRLIVSAGPSLAFSAQRG